MFTGQLRFSRGVKILERPFIVLRRLGGRGLGLLPLTGGGRKEADDEILVSKVQDDKGVELDRDPSARINPRCTDILLLTGRLV
jgi:hypothetical protein